MVRLDLNQLNLELSLRLNDIANRLRTPYTSLISELGEQNLENADWWVSVTSSRNTFATPLFINLCHLVLIDECLREGSPIEEIVVYSRAMKKVLASVSIVKSRQIKIIYSKGFKDRLIDFVRPYYNFLDTCRVLAVEAWWARMTKKLAKNDEQAPLIVLETFVLDKSFTTYDYLERFYSQIFEFLDEDDKKRVCFLATPYKVEKHKALFTNLRTAKHNFLVREDYLRLRHYIYALLHPLRMHKISAAATKFMDFDIEPMIREDLRIGICSYTTIDSLLKYKQFEGFKDKGIRIDTYIDWLENQIIDHGINLGLRENYPTTRVIGYQGYVGPKHYLCIYPSSIEKKAGVTPDIIAVIGQGFRDNPREFCPEQEVITSPAFRFRHLWQERKYHPEPECVTILVALPITIKEGNEIIGLLAQLLPDLGARANYRIWIKPHPTNQPQEIKKAFRGPWPEKFEFVAGDFYECVEKADVLISNTSGACFETVAKGIPVILIGSTNGLTHNPIPEEVDRSIWNICFTESELKEAIERFTQDDADFAIKCQQIGRTIRAVYFEPVNAMAVKSFLGLPMGGESKGKRVSGEGVLE